MMALPSASVAIVIVEACVCSTPRIAKMHICYAVSRGVSVSEVGVAPIYARHNDLSGVASSARAHDDAAPRLRSKPSHQAAGWIPPMPRQSGR